MVRKALHERKILLRLAPHITRPLPLLTPCRTWLEGAYYFIGLKLYDFISGRSTIGKSELLSKQKALERIPTLNKENLYTAVLYYDGQLDDLRYNLALVQTAQLFGATCLNHAHLTMLEKASDGKLKGAVIKDELTEKEYRVSAKVFINATGPFADNIRAMANENHSPRIRVSRGVHVLLPKNMLPSSTALLIPKTSDGRLIFAIPYQKHLLAGTTDDEATLTEDDFGPNSSEINYLLQYLNGYLDINAEPKDVRAGFGGLRPLVKKSMGQTKDLVRDHEVETDAASGLISILGGKWTTYRLMAKDTIDIAQKHLGHNKTCTTDKIILVGGEHFSHHTAIELAKATQWDHEVVKHLVSKYGDRSLAIGALSKNDSRLRERLLPGLPYTYAELQYNLEAEMAYTVEDIIARRWGTQLADWQEAMKLSRPVADFMRSWFGWSDENFMKQLNNYQNSIKQLMAAAEIEFHEPFA